MTTTCELYRFFDDNETLIYVGISMHAFVRFNQHRYRSPFFDQIAKMTIERFETIELAVAAESKAIKNETPKYNKTWRIRPGPKKLEPHVNVSARQLAGILGCGVATIYAMAKTGRIPVRRLPGFKYRWDKGEIDAWIKSGKQASA
jgi:excisionase family DNA binding protein